MLKDGFSSKGEEIHFFRQVKPNILVKFIYYNKVYRIETAWLGDYGNLHHNYFALQLRDLKQEYQEHICNSEFYRYYRSGRLQVYGVVKDKKIADVAMTAEWEMALQKIENNQADADAFHRDMEAYATSITRELLDTGITDEKQPELNCPKCKSRQLLIWNKVVKCPDEACGWLQFRIVCGVPLNLVDIENLVTKGKTNLIKDMKSNSGNKFNAYITMNDKAETSFEFENRKPKRK